MESAIFTEIKTLHDAVRFSDFSSKRLKLEQELGLTPLSRQRLGISFSENALGFRQLQQLLQDDEEKELIDPRLKMLEEE